MMRLCVGQNKGCLTRVWHSLWSWLKLMRSLRAAVVMRTGIEIKPKVRCPFQTVEAIQELLCAGQAGGECKSLPGVEFVSQPVRLVGPSARCKSNRCQELQISTGCHVALAEI